MERLQAIYHHAQPARRPLKIYSSDPVMLYSPGSKVSIDVQNEPLRRGPVGSRFAVVDYDASNDIFYLPVDLDESAVLMQGGLDPMESDPHFHQQMTYAVAMRTLENFEHALGRRLEFKSGRWDKLRLFPHAFYGANACYVDSMHAVLFGYFRADEESPGPNLPGQMVFTCLSHDIIAHELTHAIVDRLRPHFLEPSNPDVLAFHEGFADLVALFQHFSFQDVVKEQIQATHANIDQGLRLVNLANQFGYATGTNAALRSAIGKKDARLSPSVVEPHDRGSILVAAVFDAFIRTYRARIADLLRIATGGTGQLPHGDLHPDLVNRIAGEASRCAQSILTMCIRAFDYLPPVDITFGDFLRAIITADYELAALDTWDMRGALIEAFRSRGIYPSNIVSLAEESLLWPVAPSGLTLDAGKFQLARQITEAASAFSRMYRPVAIEEEDQSAGGLRSWGSYDEFNVKERRAQLARGLHSFAKDNARALFLDPSQPICVRGFHTVFRVSPKGQLITEIIVQFTQQEDLNPGSRRRQKFRGGTTVIAGTDGRIRYIIPKPINSEGVEPDVAVDSVLRRTHQTDFVKLRTAMNTASSYGHQAELAARSSSRARLADLHFGRIR